MTPDSQTGKVVPNKLNFFNIFLSPLATGCSDGVCCPLGQVQQQVHGGGEMQRPSRLTEGQLGLAVRIVRKYETKNHSACFGLSLSTSSPASCRPASPPLLKPTDGGGDLSNTSPLIFSLRRAAPCPPPSQPCSSPALLCRPRPIVLTPGGPWRW